MESLRPITFSPCLSLRSFSLTMLYSIITNCDKLKHFKHELQCKVVCVHVCVCVRAYVCV